jgi:hypothetical protein
LTVGTSLARRYRLIGSPNVGGCSARHYDVRVDAKQAARESVKRATRAGGLATARWRELPDFLVIGAKRGGTTSLYFDILEHPAVMRLYPPPVPGLKPDATKGVHYFDSNAFRSEVWYRSYFPTNLARTVTKRRVGVEPVAGEASPYYLFHPAAVDRAHALTPDSLILAQLRDPVMRTYSHWKERRRNEAEPLDFLSALDAEQDRLAGERERLVSDPHYGSYAWEQQSYATQSEYASQLARWFDLFGSERVHVTLSEDYFSDHARVIGGIHSFLGLPVRPPASSSHRNAAQGDDLDPGLRRKLSARFSEHNHALSVLLKRELPWT